MSELYLSKGLYPEEFLRPTVEFILAAQLPDGCIPWFPAGHADPWDHVEAAMGLSVAGEHAAAARAYEWLRDIQLPDGSWWVAYKDGQVGMAPLPGVRRPRLAGIDVADGRAGDRFRAFAADRAWRCLLGSGRRRQYP